MNGLTRADLGRTRLTRRTLLGGMAAVAGAAIAGACGPASVPAGGVGGPSAGAGGGPVSVKPAGEIVFAHIWAVPAGAGDAYKTPLQEMIDAFNAKGTGVTVKPRIDSDYYESLQKTQAELAAKREVALNVTPWSNILFADSALGITALEDIAPKDELDAVLKSFIPTTIDKVKRNSKTKGLPFALSVPILYYNNDVLKKAGVKVEDLLKDWESFAELGPKVRAVTGKPIVGIGNNTDWPMQSIIQCAGGRVVDDDGQPVMDSPEAAAAVKMMAGLAKSGLFMVATNTESRAAFVGGTMPLFMASIAGLSGFQSSTKGKFDLGVSAYPVFRGKPRRMGTGGSFIACYARDKAHGAAAWEFLKFVGSKEGMTIWMKQGYLNPTTFDIPALKGQEAAYTELTENGGASRETNWPGARGAELQKTWQTYLDRMIAGDLGVEDGLKQAKGELLRIIKQTS